MFRTEENIPEGAQRLDVSADDREFFVYISIMTVYGAGIRLYVRKGDSIASCLVLELHQPRAQPGPDVSPSNYLWRIQVKGGETMGGVTAAAYALAIQVAADMVMNRNEPIEEQAAEFKAARQRLQEQWAREKVERDEARKVEQELYREAAKQRWIESNEKAKELYELIRWLLDEQFRLTREGRRSTVYGTIKVVGEPHGRRNHWNDEVEPDYASVIVHTISERNRPMRIELGSILTLDLKDKDVRRWSRIYPKEPT